MAYIIDQSNTKTKQITVPGTNGVKIQTPYQSAQTRLTTQPVVKTSVAPAKVNPPPGHNPPNPGGSSAPAYAQADTGNTDYYDKLRAMKEAGIMSEFEANSSVIKNNLAKAMANLQAEKAALAPVYQNQLTSIAQNQFGASETMKESMNQAGWTGQNSGLAIGEQSRIGIGADTARAQAGAVYGEGVADANRRGTLAQQTSAEEQAGLEKWKASQLRGAEAEAWVANQERMDAVTASTQDYNAKLAATAASQKSAYADQQTKAEETKAKAASSTIRRQATSLITQAYNAGDYAALQEMLADLASATNLTDADYQTLYTDISNKLEKKSTTASKSGTTFTLAN